MAHVSYHATAATVMASQRAATSKAQQTIEGRLHAAWVNGGPSAATPRGNDRYTVTSRNGESRYTVHLITLDRAFCDCKAGQFERPCWHAAAAYLRRIADASVAA